MQENCLFSAATPEGVVSVIGIDYGTQHVGIAVGQAVTGTAQALPSIRADKKHILWQQLDKILKQWQPDALVVGLPLHMDGSTQDITCEVRGFISKLKKTYSVPVFTVDERLSTVEAKSQGDTRKADIDIDSEAARLILESWLRQAGDNTQ